MIETIKDNDLPEGWSEAQVGDLCTKPQYGWTTRAIQAAGQGLKLLRTTDISSGCVDWKTVPVCEEEPEQAEKYALATGDILVSRAGSVGLSYLVTDPPRAVFASYLIRLSCVFPLEASYVSLFFKSSEYWKAIAEGTAGIAIPNVNAAKLQQIRLPLPPLAEQKRIVAKVEELLERVNAARAHLAQVPTLLKRFRQSVLAAACSGRLTQDWREEHPETESAGELLSRIEADHRCAGKGHGGKAARPSEDVHDMSSDAIPANWTLPELQMLVAAGRSITYGILKPGPHTSNGVPYVRVADFPNDRIDLAGVRNTSKEIARNYARSMLRSGDILLSIRGTVGRVCRVPEQLHGANVTQDTARVSPHRELCGAYLEWYLRNPSLQMRLTRASKGAAVRGVNIGDVRVLQVPLPPLSEQHEIVRRVEALFRVADAVEQRVAAAAARADKLTQAILAKAFRGELVPTEAELARREGRDYEPASALLARIQAERAQGESPGTRRPPHAGRRRSVSP